MSDAEPASGGAPADTQHDDARCEKCRAVLQGAPFDDGADQHTRFCWTCGAPYLTDERGSVIPGSFGYPRLDQSGE